MNSKRLFENLTFFLIFSLATLLATNCAQLKKKRQLQSAENAQVIAPAIVLYEKDGENFNYIIIRYLENLYVLNKCEKTSIEPHYENLLDSCTTGNAHTTLGIEKNTIVNYMTKKSNEPLKSIPYLDIDINKIEDERVIQVYNKKTNKNSLLDNYEMYKKNLEEDLLTFFASIRTNIKIEKKDKKFILNLNDFFINIEEIWTFYTNVNFWFK